MVCRVHGELPKILSYLPTNLLTNYVILDNDCIVHSESQVILRISSLTAVLSYVYSLLVVRRRFHGTSNVCGVGADLNSPPCNLPSCNVCSILASGFRAGPSGIYGAGVYSSSAPGKSNGYVRGDFTTQNGRRVRCMFLVVAAAGLVTNTPRVRRNANGVVFDSYVHDLPGADELVCFDDRSCVPAYLIVYTY